MVSPTDGILLIDKDEGETSYGVVKQVKAAFGGGKGPKVGHAGTLDPFATGLLIILLGQGTKLSSFIMSGSKVYRGTLRLGVETDTLDGTGEVIRTLPIPNLTPEYVRQKAKCFVGDIEQTPPAFSAVKVKGTRAYRLARKGLEVDLKKRRTTVYSLEILSVRLPEVSMEVRCSSGTYMRSLAADLGRALGTGAHLKSLRRLSSGSFDAQKAVRMSAIPAESRFRALQGQMIPLRAALPDMEEIVVDGLLASKIRNGNQPALDELGKGLSLNHYKGGCFKLVNGDDLLAILSINRGEGGGHEGFTIRRVFM